VRQQLRRLRVELGLHRHLRGKQPVLVYSLAKVGTQTLRHVIQSEVGRPVVHCHYIATKPDWTESMRGRESEPAPLYPPDVWRGDYVRRRLAHDKAARWDIVCGVRDPLAKQVSAVFHINGIFRHLETDDADDVKIQTTLDLLCREVVHGDIGLDWFDVELRAVTGIDVYAEPFPHEAGYQIYANDRFRVLLIRFEDLNRVGPAALSEFFSADMRELPRSNAGTTKGYRDLYRRFQDTATIPGEVLDVVYGSRLARHFYSPAELDAFRAQWVRPKA
jgi:hypothetical protein